MYVARRCAAVLVCLYVCIHARFLAGLWIAALSARLLVGIYPSVRLACFSLCSPAFFFADLLPRLLAYACLLAHLHVCWDASLSASFFACLLICLPACRRACLCFCFSLCLISSVLESLVSCMVASLLVCLSRSLLSYIIVCLLLSVAFPICLFACLPVFLPVSIHRHLIIFIFICHSVHLRHHQHLHLLCHSLHQCQLASLYSSHSSCFHAYLLLWLATCLPTSSSVSYSSSFLPTVSACLTTLFASPFASPSPSIAPSLSQCIPPILQPTRTFLCSYSPLLFYSPRSPFRGQHYHASAMPSHSPGFYVSVIPGVKSHAVTNEGSNTRCRFGIRVSRRRHAIQRSRCCASVVDASGLRTHRILARQSGRA